MNMKPRNLIVGLLLAAVATWAACAAESVGGGTPGTAGTTGSGTGVAGTTGSGTGVAGTTGSGTGVAGTTGSGTGVAGTTGSGTGVAGTTGSGTGVAGTTGAAGAPVVQKDCATKTTPMNPVLINFETYTGTVTADMFAAPFGGATVGTGTAYTGPYSYSDGSTTPTLAILAGRPPSTWAVSQEVKPARTWGMGGGIWINCVDASAYKGITFWVRGSGPPNVFKVSPEHGQHVDARRGERGRRRHLPRHQETCLPAEKADIPLTADWTQVQILWTDFKAGLSGTTAVIPNGNNVTGDSYSAKATT